MLRHFSLMANYQEVGKVRLTVNTFQGVPCNWLYLSPVPVKMS